MKHLSITFLFLAGILLQSHAQLTVADDNNVGIGVTNPDSELAIGGVGSTLSTLYVENNTTTSNQRTAQFHKSASGDNGSDYSFSVLGHIAQNGGYKLIGGSFQAHSSSQTNYRSFGVRGLAGNGYAGYNYGVFGYLYGDRNGAAVFGCTNGAEVSIDDKYAGYFTDHVKITGNLYVDGSFNNPSDINLKKDIRLLSDEEISQTDKLKTLSAIKYKLKNPAELNDFKQEVLDTMKVDPRTIEYTSDKYTKDQIGLSAQEVQLVYPELVKENNDGYLSMNYIGLIPILVDALKEQEETNIKQDEAIKLQDEAILALDETVQAQAAQIEILIEEIAKLQNPEKTQ